jgi:uncharacterized protein (TIGR02453 family)
MHAPFLGFGPKALAWFEGLEKDNSKAYFDASRSVWESDARDPLERLLEELAEDLGGSVKMFRPNRDVRFSKNKAPYKTNTYGVVSVPGGQSGLYLSISSKGLGAGSGYWQMAKDQLQRYRDALQGPEGEELEAAMAEMEASGVRLWGEALKSAPRGVAKDHPRIRLLRQKDVLAGDDLGPEGTLDGRAPVGFARSLWDRSRRVMDWMDAHVGPSEVPPEARFGARA